MIWRNGCRLGRTRIKRGPFCDAGSDDMYANYAVYLCSKVCDLIADRTKYSELGEDNGCPTDVFAERWVRLWNGLRLWIRDRPSGICPVHEAEGKLLGL